jgi:hypothetical protein
MNVQRRRAHLEIGCFNVSLHRRQLEVSDVRLLHRWFARLLVILVMDVVGDIALG